MIEGDTALTPDQGATAGSYGVARGGLQIRRAAATARRALLAGRPAPGAPVADLDVNDGVVGPKAEGRASVVCRTGRRSTVEPDGGRKGAAEGSGEVPRHRKAARRTDIPGKVTGRHRLRARLRVPGMLHGRAIRPPAIGAALLSVDESSIASIPGARVVRIQSFLGVVRRAGVGCGPRGAGNSRQLVAGRRVCRTKRRCMTRHALRAGRPGRRSPRGATRRDRVRGGRPDARRGLPMADPEPRLDGPSCAVADVRTDRATIWSSSQATHGFRITFARLLGLPAERVRVIYLDGSGCYGMNGADDAAADAALLSGPRAAGAGAVEPGGGARLDPKGPPQLLEVRAAVNARGRGAAGIRRRGSARHRSLPNIPLLGPDAAGIPQTAGIHRAHPPERGPTLRDSEPPGRDPLDTGHAAADLGQCGRRARWPTASRSSPSPTSSAGLAGADPVEFRLRRLNNPRGIEVPQRGAARMGWPPRPAAPRRSRRAASPARVCLRPLQA